MENYSVICNYYNLTDFELTAIWYYFFNYQIKSKEIEYKAGRFSIDLPKFVKPVSVKFSLLWKHKIY